MLAILRQNPNAYGVSIRDEIKARTGKDYSIGTIYAALERLEERGYVSSREGEATAVRGGRRKLYFTITGAGQRSLSASLRTTDALRRGVPGAEAIA
jgi:PadR family transcriptional regulator, regulatory protein PadR